MGTGAAVLCRKEEGKKENQVGRIAGAKKEHEPWANPFGLQKKGRGGGKVSRRTLLARAREKSRGGGGGKANGGGALC